MSSIKRIRTVFLLLAVVLCFCLALVVHKALESVDSERAMRHRVVADRIVDEMERELSSWLEVEEGRPFAHYRYSYVPDDSAVQLFNLSRSPLSRPPEDPFLVCYFQIEPDGTVSSPLWPDDEQLARAAFGWEPSPPVRAVVDLVVEAVQDFWEPIARENAASEGPALAQARDARADEPAIPQPKAKKLPTGKEGAGKVPVGKQAPEKESKLSYLSRLNRGARSRQQRPTQVESSQAANVYNFLQNEANVLQEAVRGETEEADGEAGASAQQAVPISPDLQQAIARAVAAGDYGTLIDVRRGADGWPPGNRRPPGALPQGGRSLSRSISRA